MELIMSDQMKTEALKKINTCNLFEKNLIAKKVPTGIDMIVGVRNARPGRPYVRITFTYILFLRVKILFLGFCFSIADFPFTRMMIKRTKFNKKLLMNMNDKTPNTPPEVVNKTISQKERSNVMYAAGAPTTNLTAQSRNTPIHLPNSIYMGNNFVYLF